MTACKSTKKNRPLTVEMAAPTETLIVALVCKGRGETSLSSAISLLRLQLRLVQAGIKTDVHVVDHLDEAINAAIAGDANLFAFDLNIGYDAEFPVRALASDKDVVVAAYPLPVIDWKRVAATHVDSPEPLRCRGNVYSAVPNVAGALAPEGYVPADSARLGCVFIRRGVAQQILKEHPELALAGGGGRFAIESVSDGKPLEPHQTFAQLYGKTIYIDLSSPASQSGSCPYAGCVGMRERLR